MARRLFFASIAFAFGFAASSQAAELQLRESLLTQQKDAVTITLNAKVVAIPAGRPHPLVTTSPLSGSDCDIHMALTSDDLRVPFVGEIQNACSMAPPDAQSWSAEVDQQVGNNPGAFKGAFRIWLEHPPADVQSEAHPTAPEPGNTNPDHQVELHPLAQIGNLDLRSHITWIAKDGTEGFGYGPDKLSEVQQWQIEVQRISIGGETYIRIAGNQMKYNHWSLTAKAEAEPETLSDGVRIKVDLLDDNGAVVASGINIEAVGGTQPAAKLATEHQGDTFEFLGISTLDIGKLLSTADDNAKEIQVPFSFIAIGVK